MSSNSLISLIVTFSSSRMVSNLQKSFDLHSRINFIFSLFFLRHLSKIGIGDDKINGIELKIGIIITGNTKGVKHINAAEELTTPSTKVEVVNILFIIFSRCFFFELCT